MLMTIKRGGGWVLLDEIDVGGNGGGDGGGGQISEENTKFEWLCVTM